MNSDSYEVFAAKVRRGEVTNDQLNFMFYKKCRDGKFAFAQLLYHNFGNDIDIHYHDDAPFTQSSYYGRVRIAQWLYSLGGVNIHAWNNMIFSHALEQGYPSWVLWWLNVDTLHSFNAHPQALNNTIHKIVLTRWAAKRWLLFHYRLKIRNCITIRRLKKAYIRLQMSIIKLIA